MGFNQKNRKDKTTTNVQNTTTTNVEGITGQAAADLVKALGDTVSQIAIGLSSNSAASVQALSSAIPNIQGYAALQSQGLGDLSSSAAVGYNGAVESLTRGWGFVAVAVTVVYFLFHHSGAHR
jgi:hypothetical protein